MEEPRRRIPATQVLLRDPRLLDAVARLGADRVKAVIGESQGAARRGEITPEAVLEETLRRLPRYVASFRPLINATGVVVHTNIGRAPWSGAAVTAALSAMGTVDVEIDLETGQRGRRGGAVHDALCRATGAQAALVVNNGAAAVLLAVTTLAAGREVVLSRGELVEIGDSFRIPDLVVTTGARLREVGTTNRTRLADYERAIGPATGCILKVHPSNFTIAGFTASTSIAELSGLGIPVIADVGSGLLVADPALPDEPSVAAALREGADLVTASGDKLLGGPQAGLILGRADLVDRVRRHPLARAMRVDKVTLAGLEATVTGPDDPVTQLRRAGAETIERRAMALAESLAGAVAASVVPSEGRIGGGGAPGVVLPSWAVALPEPYAAALRTSSPAVLARSERGRCLIDLRSVMPDQDAELAEAIIAVARDRDGAGR